jgi:hypothetical protein
MSDENEVPIHEQAYRVVVEGQEAEKRRANAWHGGTNYGRSSFAQYGALIGVIVAAFSVHSEGVFELILHPVLGVLIGGTCGWLFGRALRFVFVTLPMMVISVFKKDRSK